ncbi:protein mono-ADP-ribosyltransferase PARP12-like [Atheta coriaria]|uniref:protein mono-ADP-ribosyltransferase PARP12-like n=1 Tax=Dalotia coriaria TaxID=877792 RepID=UPI0031F3B809
MGALLTSEPTLEEQRKQAEESRRAKSIRLKEYERAQQLQRHAEQLKRRAEQLREERAEQLRQEQRAEQLRRQKLIMERRGHIIGPVNIIKDIPHNNCYKLTKLSSSSFKYQEIQSRFSITGKYYMKVISIESIDNPIQRAMYELKKSETMKIYKTNSCTEEELYHGTLQRHFDSICKNNLDRRKCVHHKFGHGVSFSPISFYATHYCDKGAAVKIMLVCKVIRIQSTMGTQFTKVPERGYDCTQNVKGDVIVKYDDDTYYPKYVIKFTMSREVQNVNSLMSNLSLD